MYYLPIMGTVICSEFHIQNSCMQSTAISAVALGIILFVFAMAVYNIGEYAKGYKHGFDDGVKECIEAIKGNGKK